MHKKSAIIYYGGFIRFGGVVSHVKAIETELRRIGWDVTVITLDNLPIWCRYLPHFVEKTINLLNRPLGFLYKGLITKLIYKFFFHRKADVCIFEDIYLTWNSSIPSITVLHAVWSDNLQSHTVSEQQRQKLKTAEVGIIEKINHSIVTVSHPYLRFLKQEHFKEGLFKNIEVIELGINQSNFCKNKSHNKKSIVYVGSLEARKNVLFLLKVFQKLYVIDPEYKLTIIGDGPERKKLTEFVNTNGFFVSFLGSLSHEMVLVELHHHRIYLHTSTKESFSYSLLEAKLAGLITCAYARLQVPTEFIDVAIDSFEIDDWCNGILDINQAADFCSPENYTVEKMTLLSLDLAK